MRTAILLFTIAFASPILAPDKSAKPTLERLTRCMLGSFNSGEQAKHDTDYFNIELEMARIWPAAKG